MDSLVSVTEEARRRLGEARSVAVLTGAGISADSGVPTFRGPEGLWRSFRPEELATPEAFLRDPNLVWEWYDWRRGESRGVPAEPRPRCDRSSRIARPALQPPYAER